MTRAMRQDFPGYWLGDMIPRAGPEHPTRSLPKGSELSAGVLDHGTVVVVVDNQPLHSVVAGSLDLVLVEESMEMIGASLFLYSLLDHVAGASGGFELSLDNARESRLAIQANS